MKWLLIVVIAVTVSLHMVSAKSVDKAHHKKASSAKPTKTPKSIVEQFRGLPADDLAFIEQLDKQFQLHGEKVKIKVERENTTQASGNGKNSKRTIDGNLSYGYQQNHNQNQHQQFYFSKPRYEIFPYSQELISPVRQTYSKPEGPTTVEITQSQGYEIKEVPQDYPQSQTYSQNFVRFPGHSDNHHQARHQQSQEEVPVIVLKVPGPTKYAAHLRTLLQQYLEIRAAQVIRELEQQEQIAAEQYHHQQLQNQAQHYRQQQHSHSHQQHHQGLQTHVQYATPSSAIAEDHQSYHHQYQHQINSHGHVESEGPGHAVYGNPQPAAPEEHPSEYLQGEYESTAQVGQTVYEDHQTYNIPSQQTHSDEESRQQYYREQQQIYHQQFQQQRQHPRNQGHIQYAEQHEVQHQEEPQYINQTPQPEEHHHQHQYQEQEQHTPQEESSSAGYGHEAQSHLETPENFPDEKHTRVVFTKNLSQRPHHNHQHHDEHSEQVIAVTPETHHYQGPHYLPTPLPTQQEYSHSDDDSGAIQQQHYHHEQQQEQGVEEEHLHHHYPMQHEHQLEEYQAQPMATPGPFITITQKRKMNRVPFNYHAHGRVSTPPPRKREAPYTEDQFNKFSKLVNRLKKKQTKLVNERSKKSPSLEQPKAHK